jgi:hypothetical protein
MRGLLIVIIVTVVAAPSFLLSEKAFAQTVVHVDGDSGLNPPTGPDPGNSWSNSFLRLQDALKHVRDNLDPSATNIIEVWVKGDDDSNGIVYFPDDGGIVPTDPREATFSTTTGIQVLCGFAGTESLKNDRDSRIYKVVLSGDIDHDDANDTDNSFHVVIADTVGNSARLDGATITMGHSSDTPSRGGGLIVVGPTSHEEDPSQPVIVRCRFTNNIASAGGAVYIISNQNSSPDFRNCIFDNNLASDAGGAVKVDAGGTQGVNPYFQD